MPRPSELDYSPPQTGSDEHRDLLAETITQITADLADQERYPTEPTYAYLDGKKVEWWGPEWQAHLQSFSAEYGKEGHDVLARALGHHASERLVPSPLATRELVYAGAISPAHPKAA